MRHRQDDLAAKGMCDHRRSKISGAVAKSGAATGMRYAMRIEVDAARRFVDPLTAARAGYRVR